MFITKLLDIAAGTLQRCTLATAANKKAGKRLTRLKELELELEMLLKMRDANIRTTAQEIADLPDGLLPVLIDAAQKEMAKRGPPKPLRLPTLADADT